jgi:aspartate aminotransferase
MAIAKKIKEYMDRSSWIRKMFEQGLELKAKYGAEKVFDFSLGNPNLEPPQQVKDAILKVLESKIPGKHAYMPNAGLREAREAVASSLSKEHSLSIPWENVIMTCGAGGGINAVLKTLLDNEDNVIVLAPYFVEYLFYIDNHNGFGMIVDTNEDFTLDIEAIEKSIGYKTKAIILNSPNNPSGRVYSESSLKDLANVLKKANERLGKIIYLVSDEPYRKLAYDGIRVPSIFQIYPHSLIVTSYSKDLSLPGERIGYVAVSPMMENPRDVIDGLTFANRILGFVNAPALMQRILPYLQAVSVDVDEYRKKRDLLCAGLYEAGYQFEKPQGAFYVFPKSPIKDDVHFVQELLKENILAVPGTGFGRKGHFRLAYCVEDRVIAGAIDGFAKAIKRCRQ